MTFLKRTLAHTTMWSWQIYGVVTETMVFSMLVTENGNYVW